MHKTLSLSFDIKMLLILIGLLLLNWVSLEGQIIRTVKLTEYPGSDSIAISLDDITVIHDGGAYRAMIGETLRERTIVNETFSTLTTQYGPCLVAVNLLDGNQILLAAWNIKKILKGSSGLGVIVTELPQETRYLSSDTYTQVAADFAQCDKDMTPSISGANGIYSATNTDSVVTKGYNIQVDDHLNILDTGGPLPLGFGVGGDGGAFSYMMTVYGNQFIRHTQVASTPLLSISELSSNDLDMRQGQVNLYQSSMPLGGEIAYSAGKNGGIRASFGLHYASPGYYGYLDVNTGSDTHNKLIMWDANLNVELLDSTRQYPPTAGRRVLRLGAADIVPSTGTELTEGGAIIYVDQEDVFILDSLGTAGAIPKTLKGSDTLDFPSTATQTSSDLTVTVTGAADGDVVSIGVPNVSVNANTSYSAWVSSANTVTIRFNNYSTGAVDPASGTFKVRVIKD